MIMPPRFPGVILSGGQSARMGEPKALLPFDGGRLIDHVAKRLSPQVTTLALNTNDPAITLPATPVFTDRFTGFHGPLAGIHASLAYVAEIDSTATHVAIVPVDAPFFPTDLIAQLEAALTGPDDVALTMSYDRLHPVMGLWPLSATKRLQAWLENPPTLKVRAFLEVLPVRTVAFPPIATSQGEVDPFFNVNTKSDLEWAQEIFDAATSD